MPVHQPVDFKVLVVVAEGVDELLGDLEEAHVEEELEGGEDWNVEVDVHDEAAVAGVTGTANDIPIESTYVNIGDFFVKKRKKQSKRSNQFRATLIERIRNKLTAEFLTRHFSAAGFPRFAFRLW